MDETFASALRDLLVEQAETSSGRTPLSSWFSRRWTARTGIVAGLIVGGGGIAYGTGVWTLPGSEVVTPLAAPVTVTGVGTQTVQLGTPPAGTTALEIDFTCLTAGTFTFADGAGAECDAGNGGDNQLSTYAMPITAGQDSTTITATPGARWRLTATYSSVAVSAWGVNASGQTYGVEDKNGIPDLVAAHATNGRDGYVYAYQLYPPGPKTIKQALAENNAPPTRMTVYESDGKTAIGEFIVGSGPAGTATNASTVTTPLPVIQTTTTVAPVTTGTSTTSAP
ncbi:MAG: peptidase M56 family protein [Solirubrobacteraceae bacterium]